MWVVSMLLRRHMRYLVFLLSWSMATYEWQSDNNFFFLFFPFFSFPTSRFEPSWPKLNYVMSFWFCIRFDFHSFNCYLSCIESYFYLFFVPFHPLVFSFIFFSCQIWSLFFLFVFFYYFLNWICFSVSSLNI